jgi:hypothetical protein
MAKGHTQRLSNMHQRLQEEQNISNASPPSYVASCLLPAWLLQAALVDLDSITIVQIKNNPCHIYSVSHHRPLAVYAAGSTDRRGEPHSNGN